MQGASHHRTAGAGQSTRPHRRRCAWPEVSDGRGSPRWPSTFRHHSWRRHDATPADHAPGRCELVVEPLEARHLLAILTNGTGDGSVTVGVDGYGAFGSSVNGEATDATYDPVGPIEAADTVFRSQVIIWIGETKQQLEAGGILPDVDVEGTDTEVSSSFLFEGLSFDLVQTVEDLVLADGGPRAGALLTQAYTIRNTTDAAITFDLLRYMDGDLYFDDELIDGGGRLVLGGSEILFETDQATGQSDEATFLGISTEGGNAPESDRYEISVYHQLIDRLVGDLEGDLLRDTVDGDGSDADEFIDPEMGYDVTLALRNKFVLAPGATAVYKTRTIFGSGEPEDFVPDPVASIASASVAEGDSGTTPLLFTVTLSHASTKTVTIPWTTLDGSATAADNDYQPTSGTLTFAPDVTTQIITVEVVGDTRHEADEDFSVHLFEPANATLAEGDGIGTIVNDDSRSLSVGDVTMDEGDSGTTDFVFTVTLAGPISETVVVNYHTVDNSAREDDDDFEGVSGAVVFTPDRATETVTIRVMGDTKVEEDEFFDLLFYDETPEALLAMPRGTIVNDDALLVGVIRGTKFRDLDGNGLREESEPGIAGVRIYLDQNGDGQLNEIDGVPSEPFRDTDELGRYEFADLTEGIYTVREVVPAGLVQTLPGAPDFEYIVTLTFPGFAEAADIDFGNSPIEHKLSIGDVTLPEGDSGTTPFVFTVTLSAASDQTVTVRYTTQNGSATVADADYVGTSGTLTFAPGTTVATVTVLVNGDLRSEPDETFHVVLSDAIGATIDDGQGLGTILDDPDPLPLATVNNVTLAEGNEGTTDFVFTVTLSTVAGREIVVSYTVADGTATAADHDYEPTGSSLTFAPGETTRTFTVVVNGDTKVEADEQFTVNLSSAGLANTPSATGTILNDDEQALGSIGGVKFYDLDGDGTRDRGSVAGNQPVVVFIIDVSGSARNAFEGTSVGDLNGDGFADTILDAEIAGGLALLHQLIDSGLGDIARMSIVSFSSSASALDMDPVTPGIQTVTNPSADLDEDGMLDVEAVLRSLRDGGSTNYEAALSAGAGVLTSLAVARQNGNVIFLSDGDPNSASYDDEAATLRSLAANVRAFGVGEGASLPPLQVIDSQAKIFSSTDEILVEFSGGTGGDDEPGGFSEPPLGGVTIYLDLNNNGMLDEGEPQTTTATEDNPNTPDDERGTYQFTNLLPGIYVVREVRPEGMRQTYPGGPDFAHTVNVGPGQMDWVDRDFGNTDDTGLALSINDVALPEGDSGPTPFVFTITLSSASEQPVFVTYTTHDGTARVDDLDYDPGSGTLTFAPGTTSLMLTLFVRGDLKSEYDETFTVELSNAQGAGLARPVGTGTILDDPDPLPTASINDVTLNEGKPNEITPFVFTVTLSSESGRTITVDYLTVDETATVDDADYRPRSGRLTFLPGETSKTITVEVLGDAKQEETEQFNVLLHGGSEVEIGDGLGLGIILNDDPNFPQKPNIDEPPVEIRDPEIDTVVPTFEQVVFNPDPFLRLVPTTTGAGGGGITGSAAALPEVSERRGGGVGEEERDVALMTYLADADQFHLLGIEPGDDPVAPHREDDQGRAAGGGNDDDEGKEPAGGGKLETDEPAGTAFSLWWLLAVPPALLAARYGWSYARKAWLRRARFKRDIIA